MIHNTFYYGVMRTIDVYRAHTCGNLITKELFDKIQEVASGKCKPSFTKRADTFIFSGLLRCAICGCAITPERHTKNNGKTYTYLRCFHYDHNCKQLLLNKNVVLQQIKEKIFDKKERF